MKIILGRYGQLEDFYAPTEMTAKAIGAALHIPVSTVGRVLA